MAPAEVMALPEAKALPEVKALAEPIASRLEALEEALRRVRAEAAAGSPGLERPWARVRVGVGFLVSPGAPAAGPAHGRWRFAPRSERPGAQGASRASLRSVGP
jgi:hypothetical protein